MAWQGETTYREKRPQTSRWSPDAEERESFGQLLGELAAESANLVRDEMALARQELLEKLKILKSAVVTITVGVVLGTIAMMALCTALIISLAKYLEVWQAALVVGVALSAAAVITLLVGINQLKGDNLKPEKTVATFEENKEWLKEIT